MDYPCMVRCRFPSVFKAAVSRSEFKCHQNISPFKFLGQKISTPLLGGNAGLFSFTPIIKRSYFPMTVSARSSAANKGGGMEEEKGKEMQPKESGQGISSKLVKRDRNARHLAQKLEVVKHLVAENIDNDMRLEALAYSAIYLKWINAHQIPWSKDARANKYAAEICRDIFCHLERIYSRKDISVEEILVIRSIHRCLESLQAELTACVSIIRTDDVHQELTEFFNAGSLQEQLESISSSPDNSSAILPRFLKLKQQLDYIDIAKDERVTRFMNALQALDSLRSVILKGLKNAPDAAAMEMRQKMRLSEIGLEHYSSLLLSRFLDLLEATGGARWLVNNVEQKNISSWKEPLGALIISIHQLGLSGWKPEEGRAITSELKAWQESPLLETEGDECGKKIWGLRLKATLDRADRLTEEYSEALLNIFPEKVEILGQAFGILDNSMEAYTESEIRASIIFQVSSLCTLLLKAVNKVVDARGWDILAPGTAVGTLIQVDKNGSIPSCETPRLILVVDKAEGYEEVKAAEAGVDAVILLQRLPRLSHLVLKARKENIAVITSEDDEEASKIRNLIGGVVNLAASSTDGVILKSSDSSPRTPDFSNLPRCLSNAESTEKEPHVKATEIYKDITNNHGAIRVEKAEKLARKALVKTENICGPKAASCCRLVSLAADPAALFKVPKGAVIPFGSIQRAVDADDETGSRYWSLVERIDKCTPICDIVSLRQELLELVSSLSPPEETMAALSEIFRHGELLMLRPSASVEDLRGMERNETICIATISDPDQLRDAVSSCWASLYSPAAFRSRRVARVGESGADAAVLVQEMLSPDLSFVLHIASAGKDRRVMTENEDLVEIEIMGPTEDVVDVDIATAEEGRMDEMVVEIAPGWFVEDFAGDKRVSPWRLLYDVGNGKVETVAFANFSEEWVVRSGGAAGGGVVKVTVDYSKKPLTVDSNFRQEIGRRLGEVGVFLAEKLRGRWDVEGCLVGDDIYLVLMRKVEE